MTQEDFSREVELLDLLVNDVVRQEDETLAKLMSDRAPARRGEAPRSERVATAATQPKSRQVLAALEHIEEHLV